MAYVKCYLYHVGYLVTLLQHWSKVEPQNRICQFNPARTVIHTCPVAIRSLRGWMQRHRMSSECSV